MKQIFNAKVLRRYDMPDGTIIHAEIQIDDSVIMLGNSSDKFPPVPMVMHVYVSIVDETLTRQLMLAAKLWNNQKNRKAIQTEG